MNAMKQYAFTAYLQHCTDDQVIGVFEKEYKARRFDEAQLAEHEAQRRGLLERVEAIRFG